MHKTQTAFPHFCPSSTSMADTVILLLVGTWATAAMTIAITAEKICLLWTSFCDWPISLKSYGKVPWVWLPPTPLTLSRTEIYPGLKNKYVSTLRSLQLPLLILRQASCTCHTQHSKFDHDFFDFKNLNRRVGHLCCQETENWSTIPIVKQKPWRRCTLLHPSYRSNWRSMDINKIVWCQTWVQGGRKLGGKGGRRGRLFDTACALQMF